MNKRFAAVSARALACGLALTFALAAAAEQVVTFRGHEVHWAIFNSTFLKPEVAHAYGIVRRANQAVLNLSVLDETGAPVAIPASGRIRNLMGQTLPLTFRQIVEDGAVYAIATFTFDDGETLTFSVELEFPHGTETLELRRQMYRDR